MSHLFARFEGLDRKDDWEALKFSFDIVESSLVRTRKSKDHLKRLITQHHPDIAWGNKLFDA